MDVQYVKFLKPGKWQDRPFDEQFEVEEGKVLPLSPRLAHVVKESGCGVFVKPPKKLKPKNSLSEEDQAIVDEFSDDDKEVFKTMNKQEKEEMIKEAKEQKTKNKETKENKNKNKETK